MENASSRRPLIYVSGSMRNRAGILAVAQALEREGFEPFVEWIMPGEEADEKWREFATALGQDYETALSCAHAHDVYDFDRRWLDRAAALVMVAPAGKSAHTEFGYMVGKGKPAFVLLAEKDPERWDIMLLFATLATKRLEDIIAWLKNGL